MKSTNHYSLTELADLAGVTPRTVRYYLAQGLLPGVGQTGPGAKYDDRHLARLRLIRRLQAEHLPLAEIRRRLEGLADDDIRELVESDPPAPPTDSALDYLRTVLASPATPPTPPPPVAMAWASVAAPAVPAQAVADPSLTLERSQWDRIAISPDVELHVRRPLTRTQQKQVDRLVTIARELLEEDRS